MLGPVLASVHNIRFYQRLMSDLSRAIDEGSFEHFRRTCPGGKDTGNDAVIEMADDLDDFGSGGGPRRRVHRNTSAAAQGNAGGTRFAPPAFLDASPPALTSANAIDVKNQWLFALVR